MNLPHKYTHEKMKKPKLLFCQLFFFHFAILPLSPSLLLFLFLFLFHFVSANLFLYALHSVFLHKTILKDTHVQTYREEVSFKAQNEIKLH